MNNSTISKNECQKKELLNIRYCWINADYLEYIYEDFPGKFNKSGESPLVLFLDSLKYASILYFNEYCPYDIHKDEKGHYFVTNDSHVYYIDILNKDSLLLNGIAYLSNEDWDYFDFYFIDKIKGDAFKRLYKNQLMKLYESIDTIFFAYNPYWQVNFLLKNNNCNNMYIVEFDKDSILIYDFSDKCSPLQPGWRKDKKLLMKWKR